jgi:tRNA pseudouridine55 synthase
MIRKRTEELVNLDFESGETVLIDKGLNKSSFYVIYKFQKSIGVKKAGHAGTLDPKATGLLIVCTGKNTKKISEFQGLSKTYEGVIEIGKKTPSMDTETEVSEVKDISGITEEDIYRVRDSFIGTTLQAPPMYSAIKHKGKSLYMYARKGVDIARQPREITVTEFEITKLDLPEVHFRISCSKGSYIRVIADDFGGKLGCGGYLKELRRTAIGEYKVEDAFTIDEFVEKVKNRNSAMLN